MLIVMDRVIPRKRRVMIRDIFNLLNKGKLITEKLTLQIRYNVSYVLILL